MSQPINVSITMDAASFHKFRSFDLFRHQKRWRRPLKPRQLRKSD